MLELLLDEHISPGVADGLRRRNRSLTVSCIAEWEDGEFVGQQDSAEGRYPRCSRLGPKRSAGTAG